MNVPKSVKRASVVTNFSVNAHTFREDKSVRRWQDSEWGEQGMKREKQKL